MFEGISAQCRLNEKCQQADAGVEESKEANELITAAIRYCGLCLQDVVQEVFSHCTYKSQISEIPEVCCIGKNFETGKGRQRLRSRWLSIVCRPYPSHLKVQNRADEMQTC